MDLFFDPIYRVLTSLSIKDPSWEGTIKKILLVRLDHIGDLLMATPAIAALRRKFPEACIDLLGGERAKEVFRGNRDIDRILTFDATWYDPRRGKEIWPIDVTSLLWKLRREKYDCAVDLRGDFRVILLFLWLIGARRRMGFHDLGLGFLLTDSVSYDPEKSYLDLNFDALSPLDIKRDDRSTRFFVAEEEVAYVENIFKEHGLGRDDMIIGINPTSNRIEQRWSEKRFAELSDLFVKEYQAKILLLSAPSEAALARKMLSFLKQPVIDLVGKTSLGQLGALMKKLSLYIANDSGPMHLAISLKTPTIGLFGTTSVKKSWPYNKNSSLFQPITSQVDCRRPCYEKDCDPKKCFDLITVEEVFAAARRLLKSKSPSLLEEEEKKT